MQDLQDFKNVSFKRSLNFKLNSIKNHLEI